MTKNNAGIISLADSWCKMSPITKRSTQRQKAST